MLNVCPHELIDLLSGQQPSVLVCCHAAVCALITTRSRDIAHMTAVITRRLPLYFFVICNYFFEING